MKLRPYLPVDLGVLYAINQASTPGVGGEDSPDGLKRWIDLSQCFVAIDDANLPIGFITLIEPGTEKYISANLRWFEAWQKEVGVDLVYVDRIAVSAEARGRGVGEALYRAAFESASGRGHLGAEINTNPNNPGSHRFHKRLGFREIGRKRYTPAYEVAYYVRAV